MIFQTLIGNFTTHLFDYTHAPDITTALDLVKKDQYELILLDLILPDSQAINTVKIMTNEVKLTPTIIITTLDDEKLIQDAFNLGVEDYLIKDQYNLDLFIHISKQAIRRSLGKIAYSLDEDIKLLINKMQSLGSNLEKWQNK